MNHLKTFIFAIIFLIASPGNATPAADAFKSAYNAAFLANTDARIAYTVSTMARQIYGNMSLSYGELQLAKQYTSAAVFNASLLNNALAGLQQEGSPYLADATAAAKFLQQMSQTTDLVVSGTALLSWSTEKRADGSVALVLRFEPQNQETNPNSPTTTSRYVGDFTAFSYSGVSWATSVSGPAPTSQRPVLVRPK